MIINYKSGTCAYKVITNILNDFTKLTTMHTSFVYAIWELNTGLIKPGAFLTGLFKLIV